MAKRRASIDDDLFAKTDAPPESDAPTIPAEGYTRPISVGLKESELAILDQIADKEGVARNAVMRFFLRQAMTQYLAGQLEIPTSEERSKRVDMP